MFTYFVGIIRVEGKNITAHDFPVNNSVLAP